MPVGKLPLAPMAVYKLVKELRSTREQKPLVVGGARELATALRRELGRGAAPGAIVEAADPERAAALVYVLASPPSEADEEALRRFRRARVPIVCVLADPSLDPHVPYVLATDIVLVPAGSGFPTDEIVRAVAQRLGEDGIALASRAPMLRRAVCEQLISEASRRNGVLGTAVFLRGQDLPVLTLHQLRLVLGLAAAHGLEIDAQRVPEAVIVVGGGIGFRALARRLLAVVPVAGWAVKGGLAYGGTRALGEAALRLYEARVADGASAQPERGPG